MKTTLIAFLILNFFLTNAHGQSFSLNGNNLSSGFHNSGIFNTPLEWPKGSGKRLISFSGLTLSTFIDNKFAMVTAAYRGEYTPGYINNLGGFTGDKFRYYKFTRGDNCAASEDYRKWKEMIPHGAPYEDVNNNSAYDDCIDIPGVKNAYQTIFITLSDAFVDMRSPVGEIWGGITNPLLLAEVHITAWTYNYPGFEDVQFIKFEIINKNSKAWDRTQFTLTLDPEIGDGTDDAIGFQKEYDLAYAYNLGNMDGDGSGITYGAAPPAAGVMMLRGAVSKIGNNIDTLGLSSFTYCDDQPGDCSNCISNYIMGAYNFFSGYKSDGTSWINPVTCERTKLVYDGWDHTDGYVDNCRGDTICNIIADSAYNKLMIMSSGSEDFKVQPGDTQRIIISQLAARGTNHLNSIEKLKRLALMVKLFSPKIITDLEESYHTNVSVPAGYSLSQNYPNPFNPETVIEFSITAHENVKLQVYDINGRLLQVVTDKVYEAGTHSVTVNGVSLAAGIYFYTLETLSFKQTKKMVLIK